MPEQTSPQRQSTVDRRELRVRATAEQVWKAWGDPDIIAQWFADRAHGDATPGGSITHVFEKFGMEMTFEVIESVPGKTLVLKGTAPGGFAFRQQISVRSAGGETVLELVHSGFDDEGGADWSEDEYEGMDSGWKLALAILKHYLEHHYGTPRRNFFVMQPASFDWDSLARWFRSADGLSAWLTRDGSVPEVGEEYALTLRSGKTLSGRVLAWSGREVALSWREADGVIELKAFGMGPGRQVIGIRGSSWASTPPDVGATEAWMTEALSTLARAMDDAPAVCITPSAGT